MRAIIICGKYSQDIEVYYPLYRMQEEGWEVDILVLGNKETIGVYGMPLRPTMTAELDNPKLRWSPTITCQLMVLTGGTRALKYLRQSEGLLWGIRTFHDFGGILASMCHGSQLLISAGLVKGRKISGYYSIKDDIINAGGDFIDAPFVNHDRIISSPHYKHLGPWMKEVIDTTNQEFPMHRKRRGVGEGDVGVE